MATLFIKAEARNYQFCQFAIIRTSLQLVSTKPMRKIFVYLSPRLLWFCLEQSWVSDRTCWMQDLPLTVNLVFCCYKFYISLMISELKYNKVNKKRNNLRFYYWEWKQRRGSLTSMSVKCKMNVNSFNSAMRLHIIKELSESLKTENG